MTPLESLERAVLGDLDTERGGIGWWHPQMDWKDAALVGDYLLGSVGGTDEAVRHSAHEAERHKKRLTADTHWLRTVWANGTTIPSRSSMEAEREADLEISAEAVVYHACQALDRLAAAIVIVAGVDTDPVRADWKTVETLEADLSKDSKRSVFATSTEGRHLQGEALGLVARSDEFGPTDWLPWLRRTRSTNTHRAQKVKMLLLAGSQRRGNMRIVRANYRQPEWHDIEALARHDPDPAEIFVLNDSDVLLKGLASSTQAFIEAIAVKLLDVWTARREAPNLVLQPATPWRNRDASLRFEGYGKPADVHSKGSVHVHPDVARRLQASMTLDHRRGRWSG